MEPAFLIVDDDQIQCTLYKEYLNDLRYRTDTANSTKEALELIKTNNYDIILADKNMPGSDGRSDIGGMELLKYVQLKLPQTEIIMMTGYATIENAIEAMKSGAFDYLIKPFTQKELLDSIKRLLEYKAFINPENIINIYKEFHNELIEILEDKFNMDDEERHQILKAIDSKIDHFFRTQKNWEHIILSQRDALSNIANYSEQLLTKISNDQSAQDLIKKIIRESNKRI